MGTYTDKELPQYLARYWFPETGQRNRGKSTAVCVRQQHGPVVGTTIDLLQAMLEDFSLTQEAQVQLDPATAIEANEEAVRCVLKDELESVRGVEACLMRRLGDEDEWLIVVVASTRRSREAVRGRVAARMWDIEERLPGSYIDFSVYSKQEIEWPTQKKRLLNTYSEVF